MIAATLLETTGRPPHDSVWPFCGSALHSLHVVAITCTYLHPGALAAVAFDSR